MATGLLNTVLGRIWRIIKPIRSMTVTIPMYAANLPGDSSVQGYPMDSVTHLLHQMDVCTFPLRFC